MILLDTHIWVWWVDGSDKLTGDQERAIETAAEIGVSAISCWEVSKLVELNRLTLDRPVLDWMLAALAYPGVSTLGLTPTVAAASAALPGAFHRDPADQILVATARVHGCPLVTADRKILAYAHVETVG